MFLQIPNSHCFTPPRFWNSRKTTSMKLKKTQHHSNGMNFWGEFANFTKPECGFLVTNQRWLFRYLFKDRASRTKIPTSDRSPEDIFASLARSTRLDSIGNLLSQENPLGFLGPTSNFWWKLGRSAHFSRPKTLNKKCVNGLCSKN